MTETFGLQLTSGDDSFFKDLERKLSNSEERKRRLERLKNRELPSTEPETPAKISDSDKQKLGQEVEELKKIIKETEELAFLKGRIESIDSSAVSPLVLVGLYRIIACALKDAIEKEDKAPVKKSVEKTPEEKQKENAEFDAILSAKDRELFMLRETAAMKEKKCNEANARCEKMEFDFKNFKNRMQSEQELKNFKTKESVVLKFLPVIDNLERAIENKNISSEDPVISGVAKILDQIYDILKQLGVEVVEDAKVPFDPNIHEAILTVKDDTLPEDTVYEILCKGYLLNSKLIRPASVKVSKTS